MLHQLHHSKAASADDTHHLEIIETDSGILQLDALLDVLHHPSIHDRLEHLLVNDPQLHLIHTVHHHVCLPHIVRDQSALAEIVELSPPLQQLASIVDADLTAANDVELIARGALLEDRLSSLHLHHRDVRHQLVHVLLGQMPKNEDLPDVLSALSQFGGLHNVVAMQDLPDIAGIQHSNAGITHGATDNMAKRHKLMANVIIHSERRSSSTRSVGSTDGFFHALGIGDVQLSFQHNDAPHPVHALLPIVEHLVLASTVLDDLRLLGQPPAGAGREAGESLVLLQARLNHVYEQHAS
mmetsp:Transcript_57068/g.152496  ORF Transcript_57068/g.152496 Transcript_57068/m.152496 type:complete len:297 (-) Transcript_57068:1320-2210(-)